MKSYVRHFFKYYQYYFIGYAILLGISINCFIYEYSEKEKELKTLLKKEYKNVLYNEFEKQMSKLKFKRSHSNIGFVNKKAATIQTKKTTIFMPQEDSLHEIKNIEKNSHIRTFHSILLFKKLISLDSIYTQYKNHITVKNIAENIAMLYINEKADSAVVGDSSLIRTADSLACYYAGYCNEHKFILYTTVSFQTVYTNCNVPIWILFLFIAGIGISLWKKFKGMLILVDMKGTILQIGKYIYFNETSHALYRMDNLTPISLSNKASSLLKAFITHPNHTLTVEEIKVIAWNDSKANDSTVRNKIKEVKDKLKTVDKEEHVILKRVGKGIYSLSFLDEKVK